MTPRRPLWKAALRHPALAVMRGTEIGAGLAFVSSTYRRVEAARLRRFAVSAPPIRAALVAHVYYPDLWKEIVQAWSSLPQGSPLLVTVPHEAADRVRTLAAADPRIEIHPAENRGRDVAPFMALLNEGRLDCFDAVLKLHTKKSPHLRNGGLRRRVFYAALAGDPGGVNRILRRFTDPRVGLVGLAPYFRTRRTFWMDDKPRVAALCREMAPPAPLRLGFFEGSMFWVRPRALAPLRSLNLRAADFEPEAGQLDGTLHHAIERCFTLAALAAGFETRSILGRTLFAPGEAAAMQAALA